MSGKTARSRFPSSRARFSILSLCLNTVESVVEHGAACANTRFDDASATLFFRDPPCVNLRIVLVVLRTVSRRRCTFSTSSVAVRISARYEQRVLGGGSHGFVVATTGGAERACALVHTCMCAALGSGIGQQLPSWSKADIHLSTPTPSTLLSLCCGCCSPLFYCGCCSPLVYCCCCSHRVYCFCCSRLIYCSHLRPLSRLLIYAALFFAAPIDGPFITAHACCRPCLLLWYIRYCCALLLPSSAALHYCSRLLPSSAALACCLRNRRSMQRATFLATQRPELCQ